MFVAGIDAGQSSTHAAIADADGNVLAQGEAGPADEVGQDSKSTRLRDALANALADAMQNAKLPERTKFDAIVAGVSGYEGRVYGVAPRLPTDRLTLVHDATIAHAGALDGAAGVVVIAGTGSAAYGVARDGRSRLAGGWGYLFGDEGSAFWIARSAIALASMHEACAGIERLLSFFDVHSLRELVRGVYSGATTRDEVASFARVCVESAKSGATCSCIESPVHGAIVELAALAVNAAFDRNEAFGVAFVGGLTRDDWFLRRLHDGANEAFAAAGLSRAEIVDPIHQPVIGAVLLALRAVPR